jgi:hypothetical protein
MAVLQSVLNFALLIAASVLIARTDILGRLGAKVYRRRYHALALAGFAMLIFAVTGFEQDLGWRTHLMGAVSFSMIASFLCAYWFAPHPPRRVLFPWSGWTTVPLTGIRRYAGIFILVTSVYVVFGSIIALVLLATGG